MDVHGYSVSLFQRCKRPLAISKTHNLRKWRPQSLLSACMRQAIFQLSNGMELEKASQTAVNEFMALAENPGLDLVGIDTYCLTQDYCAIIRNILEYLSRLTLLTLKEIPPLQLAPDIRWQFLSHRDETGALHRWEFVDYINDDVRDHLHSWEVFGDIAAAECPMTLHLVAIGRRDGSHQHTPWCRIYAHPSLANIFKFQKAKGTKLEGDWKPVWCSANQKNTPKTWIDLMIADNVISPLVRHVSVKEVSKDNRKLFIRDALAEAASMSQIMKDKVDPKMLPMSRYACDHPYICPHQFYCYTPATLDSAGIYVRK